MCVFVYKCVYSCVCVYKCVCLCIWVDEIVLVCVSMCVSIASSGHAMCFQWLYVCQAGIRVKRVCASIC